MAAAFDAPDAVAAWVEDLLGSAAAPKAKPAKRKPEAPAVNLRPALRAFAQKLSYTLRLPGAHPSGIAYQKLLAILAEQGRDFLADSRRLREHVAYALLEQFGDDKRPPGPPQLRQIAAAAILEWVLARLEGGQRDVPIKPNDPAYRAWKRRNANYSRPGMSSGALRDALRDDATVTVR